MKKSSRIAFLSLLIVASDGVAKQVVNVPEGVKKCFSYAAKKHSVPEHLLIVIAFHESRLNVKAVSKNKNGSVDYCIMQVNSSWLDPNNKNGIWRYGYTKETLMDPCRNIEAGAWIMSHNIKTYGFTWIAIGKYNSNDIKKGAIYAREIYKTAQRYEFK